MGNQFNSLYILDAVVAIATTTKSPLGMPSTETVLLIPIVFGQMIGK